MEKGYECKAALLGTLSNKKTLCMDLHGTFKAYLEPRQETCIAVIHVYSHPILGFFPPQREITLLEIKGSPKVL